MFRSSRLYYLLISYLLLSAGVLQAQTDRGGMVSNIRGPEDSLRILNSIYVAEQLTGMDPDSAALLLQASLQESRAVRFNEGVMHSLLALSMHAKKIQNYPLAEAQLREAWHFFLSHQLPDSTLFVRLLNNFGLIYYDQGQYDKAVPFYYLAINLYRNAEKPAEKKLLVISYGNLAEVFLKKNEPGKAEHYLNRATDLVIANRDSLSLIKLLLGKSILFLLKQEPEQAHRCLDTALDVSKRTGNVAMQVKVYNNKGLLLQQEQRHPEAIRCFQTAIALSDSVRNRYDYILASLNLGHSLFFLKDYRPAEHYLSLAIRLGEHTGMMDGVNRAYEYLAQVYDRTGRPALAYKYQQKYIRVLQEFYNQEKMKATSELEIKYQTALRAKELSDKELLIAQQEQRITRQQALLWTVIGGTVVVIIFVSLLFYQKSRLDREKVERLKKEKQVDALKKIMEGEEQERKRIAEEMHDGIGGMLAALKMNFTAVQENYRLEQEPAFRELLGMLNETGKEVRRTTHNLMPDILLRYGLIKALQRYIDRIQETRQLDVSLQVIGDPVFSSQSFELALYRIFQELIQNVIKHANASHLLIQINKDEDVLSIMVEDNGTGYLPEETSGGIGLENISNRVRSFSGILSIRADRGTGTLVYMEFDLSALQNNES